MRLRLVILGTLIVLQGCATSNVATQGFTSLSQNTRLLVMPPDIKYYKVTASGITEPQADWTNDARASFNGALTEFATESGLELSISSNEEMTDEAVEYEKLYSAVGSTILINHYGLTKLPTKLDETTKEYAFDWSLGPGVRQLAPNAAQDYALFVHFRDYQASGGRIGMAIFAAMLNVSLYAGHQGGFASLVDLSTGNVVWFNSVPVAQGDMRSPEGARRLVSQLFDGLTAPAE